jgi:hypothetical protein
MNNLQDSRISLSHTFAIRHKKISKCALLLAAVATSGLLCLAPAQAAEAPTAKIASPTPMAWNEEFAYLTGMQAYIYGYPPIYYAELRHQWIGLGKGGVSMAVNQYWHSRNLTDPKFQYGGSPNRETPYSLAMINVGQEPIVLTVPPNPEKRYYCLQLTDFYSDTVGYIGVRETNNVPGDYLVVGPNWKGKVPKSVHKKVISSWTPWVSVFGRTFTDGTEADLVKMRAFQDGYKITPLSQYGKSVKATESHDVLAVAAKSDPLGQLKTMNAVMKENPPTARDTALMKQFALVGLGPMAKGDIESLDPAIKRGLARAIVDGRSLLQRTSSVGGSIIGATRTENGWFYGPSNWGRMAADGDFFGRAATQAFSGIVEHLIEEVVKLRTFVDADGQPLNSANRYVIHFTKDQIPVAKSFWSVTMYDERFNLVQNDAGRYTFGDTVPGLKYGADGSLTIYIQRDKPEGDKAANWLPSPKEGDFNLFLRAYFPGPKLVDQTYTAPPVRKQTS